jgi:hypothetical protein
MMIQNQCIHICQVTRCRRVTPGNRACHPHFAEHPSGHGFHYDVVTRYDFHLGMKVVTLIWCFTGWQDTV